MASEAGLQACSLPFDETAASDTVPGLWPLIPFTQDPEES